jgi:hypothetical protein
LGGSTKVTTAGRWDRTMKRADLARGIGTMSY